MSLDPKVPDVFKQQPDATLNQDNPESGTKYEVLPTKKRCRIISIRVTCTWTVQPTPLECHITIDGQTILASQTDPVSGDAYIPNLSPTSNGATFDTLDYSRSRAFMIEGRNVKVEVEITGGTVSNLSARVKYATK